MNRSLFDFHADDYAVSPSVVWDINLLGKLGVLDSISILPNMPAFEQGVVGMGNALKSLKKSVHLNFVEGKSCLNKGQIPDLVDENNCFNLSWGSLLAANFFPKKARVLKGQLAAEIVAQVERCIAAGLVEPQALRLDSHQHTHMIPLVQDALFEAVDSLEAQGRKVVFVRNTQDPLFLYFKTKGGLKGFSFLNMIKCLLINWFSRRFRRLLGRRNLPVGYLCGLFYSGCMDEARLKAVLPAFERFATKKKTRVEVLFHPGSVKKEEISPEFTKPGFVQFHISKNRHKEFNALCLLSGGNL